MAHHKKEKAWLTRAVHLSASTWSITEPCVKSSSNTSMLAEQAARCRGYVCKFQGHSKFKTGTQVSRATRRLARNA